jgi:potassium-transporting ATPase KdpC subunit
MRGQLLRSLGLTAVLFLLCCVLYPLAGVGLSEAAFGHQANGSLTADGSSAIGQPWNAGTSINPLWFNGRPDADNPLALNGVSGETGSQSYGPRSLALSAFVHQMIAEWRAVGVYDPTTDLVTTSGSGVDPDISPADADVQVPMVAKSRHIPVFALERLVTQATQGAEWGFLGEPTINVLSLNEALARLTTQDPTAAATAP